jgi:hypothetical protein
MYGGFTAMRARNIKPGFFTNDELAELSPITRLLFIGMWCMADRSGRIKDRPKKIKAEVLPFDDCDIEQCLEDLNTAGFITRYTVDDKNYIQISKFDKHQSPHVKEAPSDIPPIPPKHHTSTIQAPDLLHTNPPDCGLLIVDSGLMIPDSSSYPLEIATEQRAKMSIIDFRFVHQDKFGTNMPPGCNQTAHELCQQYSRESIINAFEAAAVQGKQSVAYVKGVLLGNGNGGKPAPQQRVTKTFEQIKLENTKQAMMDFVKGAPDAGHEREPQAICITHG